MTRSAGLRRCARNGDSTEVSTGVFLVPVVSDVQGTREMRELSLALRMESGLVLVAGCSHPIVAAAHAIDRRIRCIFGGLHLVLTGEPEIRRVATALRERWQVERIAPAHCTGEPACAVLQEVFGDDYVFAGLGESISLTP